MSSNDSKKNLYRLLSYPYLNTYNFNLCQKLLDELKNTGDREYYSFYGSFLLLNKKYDEAKEAFNKAIEEGATIYSTYYGLYRIALREKDYESAYKYAVLCDGRKDKTKVNFSLQSALAKMTMDIVDDPKKALKTDYSIDSEDILFTDFSANLYYEKAIEAFNNRDIFAVRENIIKICESADMKEAAFNFFELVDSIDSLILLQRDAYFESVKACDPEYKVSPREILNYINMTVDTDPDAAYMAFRIEEDWLSDEVDPLLVSYVDRRINERRCYKDLDKNQFRFFRYSRHQIREKIDKNNYAAAIEDCDKVRMNLDVPLFLYYKGKALYLSGKYEEATKVLERYLEVGAAKFDKASYYLSESSAAMGNDSAARDVRADYNAISNYFVDSIGTDKKYVDKKRKEDRKGSGTKNLSVNFTNLMSSDLTLSEYETYCFRQKIGVVAGLYCDKSGVKKADKLISKLEKEAKTSDEKNLVRAVRQNKKLLLAKGTKGFKK